MGNWVWVVTTLAVATFVVPLDLLPSSTSPAVALETSSKSSTGSGDLPAPDPHDGNGSDSRNGKGGTLNCRATTGDASGGATVIAMVGLAVLVATRRRRQRC